MIYHDLKSLETRLKGVLAGSGPDAKVAAESSFRGTLTDDLVETAVFTQAPEVRARARFAIKQAAAALGIHLASIHDLYAAMGRGEAGGFTVPAMNLRGLAYDSGRAFFRAAMAKNCGAFLFEIAKSEIGYTDQRPGEYVAVMLGAALREGYTGPGLHPGGPLPGFGQVLFQGPRGRDRGPEDPHPRGADGRFLQHRHRLLDARRARTPRYQGAAEGQRRRVRRAHPVHP